MADDSMMRRDVLRPRRRRLFRAAALGLVLGIGGARSQASGQGEAATESGIEIKRVASWGLGPAMGEVHDFMVRAGQTGPLFAVFVGACSGGDQPAASGSLTRLGFVVDGEVSLEAGYARETIPEHLAATLNVRGRYGMSAGHHRTMLEWIKGQGYVPVGDIVEVYPTRGDGAPEVEVRIAVVAVAAHEVEEPLEARSVADMAAAGDYEGLARAVVPRRVKMEHRAWLADVIDRVRVIREIVRKKFVREGGDLAAMLSALVDRAGAVLPHAPEVGEGPAAARPLTAERGKMRKRDILDELDRILVRAHLKAMTPTEIREGVVSVISDVRLIVGGEVRGESTGQAERSVDDAIVPRRGDSGL